MYAGLFKTSDVPPETVDHLAYVEIPKMLYPFAREIVATLVRVGNFPQALLPQVDFEELNQKRLLDRSQPQSMA